MDRYKDQFKSSHVMLADCSLFDLDQASEMPININNVIQSVCYMARFNGHLDNFYSVGSHIVGLYATAIRMKEPRGVRRMVLAHDLHEFITGDIVSPVKRRLQPQIGELEKEIDKAIFKHLKFLPTPAEKKRVAYLDDLMWQVEQSTIQNLDWIGLEDDLYLEMRRAVMEASVIPVQKIGDLLNNAIAIEFEDKEVMQ